MIAGAVRALLPRGIAGQMLLTVALALLAAQLVNAMMLYRGQEARQADIAATALAVQVLAAANRQPGSLLPGGDPLPRHARSRLFRPAEPATSPDIRTGETRQAAVEARLRELLAANGLDSRDVRVVLRERRGGGRFRAVRERIGRDPPPELARGLLAVASVRSGSVWLVARVPTLRVSRMRAIGLLALQTGIIYAVVLAAVALLLRRITGPLRKLTGEVQRFGQGGPAGTALALAPAGPADIRDLIGAYNAMAARIGRLLDEKDVMLGAIGHDLKTPLAVLRVRIEGVADDEERLRMAATIDEIARTLDDILSLARVGRPSDMPVRTDLRALVETVADEFADLGSPLVVADGPRVVAPVRETWVKRAVRNLAGNALRYAGNARITVETDGTRALIRIEDDGPGIAEDQIGRLTEPFARLDAARGRDTGGAGLGLALARAIAEQHGGVLQIVNRRRPDGTVAGLAATLALPL